MKIYREIKREEERPAVTKMRTCANNTINDRIDRFFPPLSLHNGFDM